MAGLVRALQGIEAPEHLILFADAALKRLVADGAHMCANGLAAFTGAMILREKSSARRGTYPTISLELEAGETSPEPPRSRNVRHPCRRHYGAERGGWQNGRSIGGPLSPC
jgi:hypothetical protein